MWQSESITDLIKALVVVQGVLENAKKDSQNSHLKNTYASLPAVIQALKEPMVANGLGYTQLVESDGDIHFLTTILVHSSGQWIRSSAKLLPLKNDSQSLGSACTYMRRYALTALMGISQEDDDGVAAGMAPDKNPSRVQKTFEKISEKLPDKSFHSPKKAPNVEVVTVISKEQVTELLKHVNMGSELYGNILRHFGIQSLESLPANEYDKLLARVSQKA